MIYVGVTLGLAAMLLFTPYCMAVGIKKMQDGNPTFGQKVTCMIPLFNLIGAEKEYYGSMKSYSICTLLSIVLFVQRFVVLFTMRENTTLAMISIGAFLLSFVVAYIGNAIFVYTVINDTAVVSKGKTFLYALAYPFGQYYIGTMLPNVVRNNQRKAETFI